jgi:hypothetical protein
MACVWRKIQSRRRSVIDIPTPLRARITRRCLIDPSADKSRYDGAVTCEPYAVMSPPSRRQLSPTPDWGSSPSELIESSKHDRSSQPTVSGQAAHRRAVREVDGDDCHHAGDVDPPCAVLGAWVSHFADQLTSLEGDSRAPTSRASTRSIFPSQSDTVTAPAQDGFGLNDFQCVAPGRPPPRHKHPEQAIDRAKLRAPRPSTFEHCQLMLQCNALPNQRASAATIRAGSFNGVTVEANHWADDQAARSARPVESSLNAPVPIWMGHVIDASTTVAKPL